MAKLFNFAPQIMETLDAIFDLLGDGEWHSLPEISAYRSLRKLTIMQLMMTLHFLAEYKFIELSEAWKGDPNRPVAEAKLTPCVQMFIRSQEREAA